MKLVINNEEHKFSNELSLQNLLIQQGISQNGTAIAINDQVVSRQLWSQTILSDGDKINVFTVVAGG